MVLSRTPPPASPAPHPGPLPVTSCHLAVALPLASAPGSHWATPTELGFRPRAFCNRPLNTSRFTCTAPVRRVYLYLRPQTIHVATSGLTSILLIHSAQGLAFLAFVPPTPSRPRKGPPILLSWGGGDAALYEQFLTGVHFRFWNTSQ